MKKLIAILILSAMLTGCAVGSNENNSSGISSSTFEEESSPEEITDSIYADYAKDIKSVCDNAVREFEDAKNKWDRRKKRINKGKFGPWM